MASNNNSSSSGGNSPFAWLGLLKWSLAYSDGTSPSSGAQPMSKEDVEFLEKVMSEGIIDEGQRMKEILKDLTKHFENMLGSIIGAQADCTSAQDKEEKEEEKRKELFEEEDVIELIQELRDIVEQIDYARAFMAMGGLPFLLGVATFQSNAIPKSLRTAALGVLSTMCQNNPPVQMSLLEQGHIPQLVQLFFEYTQNYGSYRHDGGNSDDSIREKTVQAISASVREHSMAEHIFCMNEQGRAMLKIGMGMLKSTPKPSVPLRKRTLFFIRALLTSDNATLERHSLFQDVVSFVCTHSINEEWEENAEMREMSLSMLSQLLLLKLPQQVNESCNTECASSIIRQHKNIIGSVGVKRIQAIRNLDNVDDKEFASLELEAWETLMTTLAQIDIDAGIGDRNEGKNDSPRSPPLAICDMQIS